MKALVTGGCGFIGSHVVRTLLQDGWDVTNLDALTYAANMANVAEAISAPGYDFVHGDICDGLLVGRLVSDADLVLNFAAETHVDRSLLGPAAFVRTDVEGVVTLLEALRAHPGTAFLHMSTDEVFGTLEPPCEACEDDAFAPTSPYSASKAAAELQIRAYAASYGMPVTILRACNIYGPNQHIEKFIPLFITRALAGEPLPLYGDGLQEREWLHVHDLVAAIRLVISALPSEGLTAYHVGSRERVPNIDVANQICAFAGRPSSLITPVVDRPGHDRRYALDSSKFRAAGWRPRIPFKDGLAQTIKWYRDNPHAWANAATGDGFEQYFAEQYGERLAPGR